MTLGPIGWSRRTFLSGVAMAGTGGLLGLDPTRGQGRAAARDYADPPRPQ